ncbi:MAG: ribosome small subunit-dependent GTPase A [Ignavibacteria bacterium]|jgi:ribosome biogenesis GTPase|nr:ribosome small subunit-dependent GTPase A [Ignavibacteria bacterium]
MTLEDLGFNDELEKFRIEQNIGRFDTGRVTAEHKERYIVKSEKGEYEAEITGAMRYNAEGREDFPAVGDWVALTAYDSDFAVIRGIFPRFSVIKRQAAGSSGEIQIIAANIDFAFLVQSADRDFNINRLERYLTICNASGIKPVIVLSKIDLISETSVNGILENIRLRVKNVPVFAVSNMKHNGYKLLHTFIEKGKTYCLLGSSGVGKSTLLNNLSGKTLMRTGEISGSTNKGKHITSHRELIILENGGILIDNPGMREVGIADASGGLEITFDDIFRISQNCKFKDCTHTQETGCAVIEAVENGEIKKAVYDNYSKMLREKAYFESTAAERRRKEKVFGKMMKNYKKDIRKKNF